jgi:hypothetical protein
MSFQPDTLFLFIRNMCLVGKTFLSFGETGLFGIRIMCLVGKTFLPFGETGLFGIRIM